ncbi:unnamed protein product, partial [Adineta ricciae]
MCIVRLLKVKVAIAIGEQRLSLLDLNRYTRTYETNDVIVIDTFDFKSIEALFLTKPIDKSQLAVRQHTTWLIGHISSDDYQQLARFDSTRNRFIVNQNENLLCRIHEVTGELTLLNNNDENLVHSEIILHAESGLGPNDAILHDIYRFIRLLPTTRMYTSFVSSFKSDFGFHSYTVNCTSDITISLNETLDIVCSIDYEYAMYNDLEHYQPQINLTFYLKENHSLYTSVISEELDEMNDLTIDQNRTLNWTRSIKHTIESIDDKETNREYICMITPDASPNKYRICRTRIHIQHDNSSTVRVTRSNQLDLIDIFIVILITVSCLLFVTSLILYLIARKRRQTRRLQIQPEILSKTMALPVETKPTLVLNNNEISLFSPQQQSLANHRHKPGCPQYIPSPENNLLSSDLFTHTTIDNMTKIILPDIPETTDLFDNQTYIHLYLPSKPDTAQRQNQ